MSDDLLRVEDLSVAFRQGGKSMLAVDRVSFIERNTVRRRITGGDFVAAAVAACSSCARFIFSGTAGLPTWSV